MTNSAFTVGGTAISGGGSGPITSVGIVSDNTAALTVSGSPITTSGNIALTSIGNFLGYQIFTTSGTWTKPTGCNTIIVQAIGGGGAGGGCSAGSGEASAGGGGGGGYCQKLISVTSISSVPVTIGAAGIAVVNNAGGAGGNSLFGSYVTAGGGLGGSLDLPTTLNNFSAGGIGGVATGGDLNIPGATGGTGRVSDGLTNWYNVGGNSILGMGGVNATLGAGAPAGNNYGGGGAGVVANDNNAYAGGNGASGVIMVYHYA